MHKPDFWTSYAEAMELTAEGNRLIAHAIAHLARGLWRRAGRSLDSLVEGLAQRRHQPPL